MSNKMVWNFGIIDFKTQITWDKIYYYYKLGGFRFLSDWQEKSLRFIVSSKTQFFETKNRF